MKSLLMLVADDPQSASALRRAVRAVCAFDVDATTEGQLDANERNPRP
jgi:hypothetical protein